MGYATARKLDFTPGTRYAYSNYGYLLLGRIIEKVSGMSYESTSSRGSWRPPASPGCGSAARSGEAFAAEVRYVSQYSAQERHRRVGRHGALPLRRFNMANQDANGGWLASAVDLVRFAKVFDAAGPVLNATSIGRMFAKPEIGVGSGGSWYGAGWSVRRTRAAPQHLA